MSRIYLSFILFSFLIDINNVLAQTPEWEWGTYATGDDGDHSMGLVTDSQGNIIQTGNFHSTSLSFSSDTLTLNGNADIFIAKYSQNGNLLWAKNFGGVEYEISMDIAIDESDCFYICGDFRGDSLNLGNLTLLHIGDPGDNNFFIAKFDNNGNPMWAKASLGEGESNPVGIAYKNGFVYQTGWFLSDSIIIGNDLLSCQDNGSFFIAKYDSTGNAIWTKQANGSNGNSLNNSQGYQISIDNNDNVIIVGRSNYPSLNFDSLNIQMAPSNYTDFFIVKYNSIGNAQWVKKAHGSNSDAAWSIVTDFYNNCYVLGSFGADLYFDTDTLIKMGTQNLDIFIVKYNELGNEVWVKSFGTASHEIAPSIDIDEVGNLYVAGQFNSNNFMFDTILLDYIGSADAFVIKLKDNGGIVWAKSIGSLGFEYFNNIAVSAGNIYISGHSNNTTLVFGIDSITLPMQNSWDMFLVKLGNCNINTSLALFNDTLLCNNQSLQLNIDEGVQYLWNTGDTAQSISISQGGLYSVFIADTLGCIKTDSLLVSYYNPADYLISLGNDTNLCNEQLPVNLAVGNNNFLSYNWNNGDTSQTIQIANAGLYIVSANYECGTVYDSIFINLYPSPYINLGIDTILCNNQSMVLTAPQASFYAWSNGQTLQQIAVNTTGIYYVDIIDSIGCIASDTISITNYNPIDYELNLGNDISLCYAQLPVILETTNTNFDTYNWNTGNQSMMITAGQQGIYILSATYSCGIVQDSIHVDIFPDPQINLGADTSICIGSTLMLHATSGTQYLWSNGSTEPGIEVTDAGVYSVEITNVYGCESTDEIVLNVYYKEENLLPNDTSIVNGHPVNLNAFEGYFNYQWSDGNIGISNIIYNEGIYYITANDMNGCAIEDSIKISSRVSEMIIPGIILIDQPLKIINLIEGCSIRVYNSLGQLIYFTVNYKNNYYPLWSQATYLIKLTTPEGIELIGKSIVGL